MVGLKVKDKTLHILGPWHSNYICSAWVVFTKQKKKMKRKWVMALHEAFCKKELHKVGFPVNVMAGAGLQQQGNHWIGMVIDAPASTIFIGDSQEYLPSPHVISMINWFLECVFPHQFSIKTLASSMQPRNWSCSEYSINMITHHFLLEEYPLPGSTPVKADDHQIHLFHDALKIVENIVGLFLHHSVFA
jgi:hypothetical protein